MFAFVTRASEWRLQLLTNVVVIGLLILANGFFAAVEMAVATARRTRLKTLAEAGDQRAAKALAVQDNPGDFLAMVQIGITLVGTTAALVSVVVCSCG